jgi:hypothetical protein
MNRNWKRAALAVGLSLLPAAAQAAAQAPACEKELGQAKAKALVDACIQVSPATHPPCNGANPCALIRGEVARGCDLLDEKGRKGAAASCALAPDETALFALAHQWSDALSHRQADDLKAVYAAKVRLYGMDLGRDAAIASKRKALAQAKDYAQSIEQLNLDGTDAAHPQLTFQKKWKSGARASEVQGLLVFAKDGGRWAIATESDSATEARQAKAAKPAGTCDQLAMDVVASTAEAKALLGGPTDPAHGHPSNGLRVSPPDAPTGTVYSVAVHESHEDHLTTLGWFDVDVAAGTVSQTLPEERALTPDAALVAKLKAACKR